MNKNSNKLIFQNLSSQIKISWNILIIDYQSFFTRNIYYIFCIKLKLGADKVNTIISSKKADNSSTRFTLSSYQHSIKMMKVHIKVIIEFIFLGILT